MNSNMSCHSPRNAQIKIASARTGCGADIHRARLRGSFRRKHCNGEILFQHCSFCITRIFSIAKVFGHTYLRACVRSAKSTDISHRAGYSYTVRGCDNSMEKHKHTSTPGSQAIVLPSVQSHQPSRWDFIRWLSVNDARTCNITGPVRRPSATAEDFQTHDGS